LTEASKPAKAKLNTTSCRVLQLATLSLPYDGGETESEIPTRDKHRVGIIPRCRENLTVKLKRWLQMQSIRDRGSLPEACRLWNPLALDQITFTQPSDGVAECGHIHDPAMHSKHVPVPIGNERNVFTANPLWKLLYQSTYALEELAGCERHFLTELANDCSEQVL